MLISRCRNVFVAGLIVTESFLPAKTINLWPRWRNFVPDMLGASLHRANYSASIKESSKKMSAEPSSVYDFEAKDIDGNAVSLSQFRGNVLMITNVACECGYTKRTYEELTSLLEKYHQNGLRILLFPCNQFGGQEPGPPEQIKSFIGTFSDKFSIFEKVKVNGDDAIPLFKYLKKKCPGTLVNAVKWNFTKFLVGPDGVPIRRYGPNTYPLSFEDDIKKLIFAEKAPL